MLIKKHLKYQLLNLFYHLKSIHILAFIPFAGVNIILPLAYFIIYSLYPNPEKFLMSIQPLTFAIVPLFSGWSSLFILREYIEGNGNELLFSYTNRIKYVDALLPFILYLISLSLVLVPLMILFPDSRLMCLWLYIICLFTFSFTYGILFISKSVTITLMCCLLYHFLNISLSFMQPVFILYGSAPGDVFNQEFQVVYLPMIIASVIFTALGIFFNYRYTNYN